MAGSMSGVTVSDEVVTEFNNIKLGHKYRYIQMKISDDKKVIQMEKTVESAEYEDFVRQLPDKICRYAIFDFEYDLAESGQRQQLIFVVWCPDTAPVHMKMLYAASKDAVKKKLVGINHEIQATEYSELSRSEVTEKVKSKMYK
jgi:cofilin